MRLPVSDTDTTFRDGRADDPRVARGSGGQPFIAA
jgi:hypothetical protein